MHTKHIGIVALVVVVALIAFFFISRSGNVTPLDDRDERSGSVSEETEGSGNANVAPDTGRVANPDTPPTPSEKLRADTFTGVLQGVDTGCFADGECSVEVDGAHVTVLMGWSRDTVGSVLGVEGFGDLEQHIGNRVEVYAQEVSEGAYTLYGSEGFYIKLLPGQEPRFTPPTDGVVSGGGCSVAGCSSQLCVDASEADVVSTCEWREEYACYRNATCERQADGRCGWTMTPELVSCIETADRGEATIEAL